MAIELITNTVNNYVYIFVFLGGIIGTFAGVMLPYYREKRKYGKEGIDLIFDPAFLKVAAAAFIASVTGTGAIFPTLLAGSDSSASYFATLLTAATTAFTINIAGNWIIGTNNKEAEQQLVEKKAAKLAAIKQLEGQQQSSSTPSESS